MSNNPNNPYHLQSTWNPFPNDWERPQTQQNSQTSNPPIQGFASFAYQPNPVYQQAPRSMPPPTQMSPEEYNQFLAWRQSQQAPDAFSVEETTPTPEAPNKGKGKKTKKDSPAKPKHRNQWTPQDELRLAQSWISVSENSQRGTDQDGSSFWYLVMDSYNARDPPFMRGKDALSSKWRTLNADCNKFQGVFNRLNDQRRSGEGADDLLMRCHHQYKVENDNKSFTNLLAWEFLKDKQKWLHPEGFVIGRRNVPKRREAVSLEDLDLEQVAAQDIPDVNEDLFGDDMFQRPQGKSRKKKSQKTSSGSAASSRASLDDSLAETFAAMRGDKQGYYETKDLEAKLRIMSMPTENLSSQARYILELEKKKICQKMGWPYESGAGDGGSGSGSGTGDV